MTGLGLQQKLTLGQTLSPQMQQSLHLLQAPTLELEALVRQEIETNPVLEEAPKESEDSEWEAELEELRQHHEEWRDFFAQNSTPRPSNEEQERRQFLFDSQVSHESLSDHLVGQLTLATEDETTLKIGEEIIGNLNDDGFLCVDLDEICQATGAPRDTVESTLRLIQSFHPPGIAARDLRETLLIQLEQRGQKDSLAYRIVHDHLDLLSRRRISDLAKACQAEVEKVKQAAEIIARLQPRPGAAFAPDNPQNIILPEASFVKEDGCWKAILHEDRMPRLRISAAYKDLLGQAHTDPQLRDYLRERIRAGKFFIQCIHQRQATLQSILDQIILRQSDFLDQGIRKLHPMTMAQIAQAVGVHETTISRAIAGKYVQTPWGILPLKFFFTSGYQTAAGEALSNTSIKEAIAELIERESPSHPLSDAEIVEILAERGIELARRTVAKYRAMLGILPSNLRRER